MPKKRSKPKVEVYSDGTREKILTGERADYLMNRLRDRVAVSITKLVKLHGKWEGICATLPLKGEDPAVLKIDDKVEVAVEISIGNDNCFIREESGTMLQYDLYNVPVNELIIILKSIQSRIKKHPHER